MKSRESALLNGTFFASAAFFFLTLGLFVNYLLGMAVSSLEDTLIARIERETKLRVGYDSLGIGSFSTIVLKGVEVRHAEEGRSAPLASLEKAELSFRPLALLFGKGTIMENISAIHLDKPEINFYSDTSLISAITAVTKKQPNTEEALPPLINCDLSIDQGSAKFYAEDSYRQSVPAAPLAAVSLSNVRIDVQDNKGHFRVKSGFSALPDQDLASGALDLGGVFDLDAASVDALIAFSSLFVGGVHLPDLQFFAQHEDELFKLDSSSFGQVLNIEGEYQRNESGRFVLNLDEKMDFFDRFITQEAQGVLGRLFFSEKDTYTPSGKAVLDFKGESFTVESDLAIRDGRGNDVFRLRARGDERGILLERLELARAERLVSLSARWDWQGIPYARATVRGLDIGADAGSMVLDGDLILEPGAPKSLRLLASGLRVNGAPIGNLDLEYNTESKDFSLASLSGSLRGQGRFAGDGKEILLALRNLDIGALSAGFLKNTMFAGWQGTGDARVVFGESGAEVSGTLAIAIPGLGVADTDFAFAQGVLSLHRLSLAQFALRGTGRFGQEDIQGDFVFDYGGKSYPMNILYRKADGRSQVNLDIRELLHAQADIAPGAMHASFELNETSLLPFGFDARLSGDGVAALRNGQLTSDGNFSLTLDKPYPVRVDLALHGDGTEFDIRQLVCLIEGRAFTGSGALSLDEQKRWNASLLFDNGITANGYLDNGAYGGVVALNDLDIAGIVPELASGILRGSVYFSTGDGFPSLSWSLDLNNGKILGIPVRVRTQARAHESGFSALSLLVQSEIAEINVGDGWFLRGRDGYECMFDASLRWKGAPFPLQARLRAEGGIRSDATEATLAFSDIRASPKTRAAFTEHVRFAGGKIVFQRMTPSGLEGTIDTLHDSVDLNFSGADGALVSLAGKYGQNLELAGQGAKLPLSYLENFPSIVRSARGTADIVYRVDGVRGKPDFSGILTIDSAAIDTRLLHKPLTEMSVQARFTNSVLYLDNLSATNGSGALYAAGQAVVRNGALEDIDARLRTDRKHGIDVDIDTENLKTSGEVLADLFISGSIEAPQVQGRLALHDNEFYYMKSSNERDPDRERIVNRVRWGLEIAALGGVRYVHPLVTAILQPGSGIMLRNSIIDGDLNVSGTVTATRGTIDYINHEFRVEPPTYIEFRNTVRGVDPWLTFQGRLRLKDEDYEDIDILLTFDGSLAGGINPVFSSEPARSQHEIRALLGLEQAEQRYMESGDRAQESLISRSADVATSLVLNPLSREIRQFLGLDIFTLRTPLVKNFFENEMQLIPDKGNKLSIFRDFGVSAGKYITSFMFVEYSLILKDSNDPVRVGKLTDTHQIGLEFTYEGFNLGYAYKPSESSSKLEYEHGIEARFRARF